MKFEHKNDLIKNFNFEDNEENMLKQTYDNNLNIENMMDGDTLCRMALMNLPVNGKHLINFLQSYYDSTNLQRRIKGQLTFEDYATVAYILINANDNEKDSLFYKVDTFFILHDIMTGTIGSHKEKSFDYRNIKMLFEYLVQIFIDYQLPKNKDLAKEHFDESKFNKFLRASLSREDKDKRFMYEKNDSHFTVDKEELAKFLKSLVGLESFFKMYFKLKFFGVDINLLISTVPIYFEPSEILTTDQYLFLCLSNANLKHHKMAFRFYDTRRDGFYLPNAIFSFMGFEGPIAFFFKHVDQETKKECILGGLMISNVKETFKDKCCGDENTVLFSFNPKLEFYQVVGNLDKILHISSNRFNIGEFDPGIGFGNYHDQYKLWIDTHDVQHKSYFMKYDDVFEEGSPFEEAFKYLNVKSFLTF
jgi:hypothetical protein